MAVECAPLISVVIIFYNSGAAFLREAIASVKEQTLDNWELLLVDDGSSDGSTEVARAAAAADPGRVHYLQHEHHANRGMSASRNRGIEAARGRYLAFLDADDTYLPERLAHHVAILEAEPEVAMVYGPYVFWHSWEQGADQPDRVSPLGLATEKRHDPPSVLMAFLASGGHILPGICSVTVRSGAVRLIGGFESAFRGCYEDQVFLAKITARFSVHITGRCLDRYRQHGGSCTAQAQLSGDYRPNLPHPSRERFLRWLDGYLPTTGVRDPGLRQAVAIELWPYDHPKLYATFILPLKLMKLALKGLKRSLVRRMPGAFGSSPSPTSD